MTYPPQQPENGWSDNQQQPQQPVDPFAQGAPGHQAEPVDPFGQPPQQYAPQQQYGEQPALPQQPQYGQEQHQQQYDQGQYGQQQYDQGQYGQHPPAQQQYGHEQQHGQQHPYSGQQYHEEPPTDQTQAYVADPQQHQQHQHAQQHQQPQQHQQHEWQQAEHTQVIGGGEHTQMINPNGEHTQVIGQHGGAQYGPQYGPGTNPPVQPQTAPVSASPSSGQQFVPPVSASPASSQPYSTPVSASPASGGGFGHQYQSTPPGVPASPFAPVSAAPASAAPASAQPWSHPSVPQFTPKKRRGLPSWVYVVGVVVIVAALAVGAIFYFGVGNNDTPVADPPASKEPENAAVLLIEEGSGLGYLTMADPWADLGEYKDLSEIAGFTSYVGQYTLTETGWMSLFAVGTMDAKALDYETGAIRQAVFKFAELSEAQTVKLLEETGRDENISGYGRDVEPVYTQLRVDGRNAGFIQYHVAWEDSTNNETGTTVTLGLIDIGDGKLAGFLIDVPDTAAAALAESTEQAMNTLQFS
ncbi:hypothetical protein [Stackebrandtia soli]|uniref:hypothetical protein n=1 Tax=Stackebrandtia soli TaxID=1892856 RepID=UPI0039ED64C6